MANTTWKQVVLDTADAYREANGTTDKIPVGQLANKVRAGAGTPYTGDNPLTIGQAGFTFPAKTLLKDGLQIINGVNGEDLTDTAADQTTAVTELMRMVNRKIAMNNGEGQYVWKKLTAEGGEFIDFVVSADTGAYPNGGTQDGHWYELVEEGIDLSKAGFTKASVDVFTVSSNTDITTKELNHSLSEIPEMVYLFASSEPTTSKHVHYMALGNPTKSGTMLGGIKVKGYGSSGNCTATATTSTIKVSSHAYSTIYLTSGLTYTLVALA